MILNQKEIRTQVLEESNFNEGKLFKLEQGWILRLKLSTKIIDQNVKVYCNLPPDPALEFTRSKYFEYKWKYLANSIKNDEFNKFVDINCHLPGAFNYYFTYAEQSEPKKGGSNFLVDPKLCLKDGRVVQAESLQFHTFLSKLLGPLDEWKSRLQVSKETGYNMIHFTPVQGLSRESNSSYSIRDHLNLVEPADSNGKFGLHDLKNLVQEIYNDWNMFSLCDLVYNHMSNDSEFLKQHPNGAYNLVNSPHLIPAFVLDRIFYHATLDIAKGVYTARGISSQNPSPNSMEALRHILRWEVIPKCHLEEYFCADVAKILGKIKEIGLAQLAFIEKNLDLVKNGPKKGLNEEQKRCVWNKFGIIQDKEFKKLGSGVDYDLVVDLLSIEFESLRLDLDLINSGENSNLLIGVYEKFSILLNQKNDQIKCRINEFLTEAVNNVISNYYYFFFAPDGPKWSHINKKQPIVQTYFYFPFEDDSVLGDEKKVCCQDGLRIQAHNGWVMGDDPLRNFADESSTVYLRRQLIPWGDSVKLRYGNCPQDNPQLWTFMEDYTRQTAQIFHGVRLDNCHSTPIHVAQYYLDIARQVRPNLFVIAELFTNSEFIDNKFVAELGITSLVRESMNAWNANELGRLVHRFGGIPVGSFFQSSNRALQEGIAHAIFYDVTHDNKCLITSRSVYDAFASSSLVLMCDCAVGSTRGFDELVPHHINVVTEARPYKKWDQKIDRGIQKGKLLMNNLHFEMGVKGYSQIYVDQFDDDTTVVTRHNPSSHESYILISRTSFSQPNEWTPKNVSKPLYVPSRIERVVFEAGTVKIADSDFKPSDDFINGLENFHLNIQENVNFGCSSFIDFIDYDGSRSLVNFKNFPPGSVICFKVVLNDESKSELPFIRKSIAELLNTNINQESFNNEIEIILNRLNFDELNILLYRCSQEETSEGIFSDVYNVPNYGPLVYAGIQGFISVMERERLTNNLGHPLFQNLRNGDWILNYTADRLKKYAQLNNRENLMALHQWLFRLFGSLSHLPRYLIPAYFDLIISGLYNKSTQRSLWLMSASNQLNTKLENFDLMNASKFLEGLCLAGISLVGNLTSAKLPDTIIQTDTEPKLSLSAGLPHFSTTYMRNWGRDTFISIPGLLLLTNRFTDAKNLILSYGSCLRHGLIPNLLSEGKSARYNCRDSIWWWLKSVKDYTELAPNGYEILDDSIYRLYPTDDSEHPSQEELANRKDSTKIQKLCDVIQEAMSVHLNGLKFRERNAGTQIDDRMKSEGFNNEIGVDLETGFVFGGNEWNAGTWMDKMGSSEKTGNTGFPATPRDGSAVELVGLCRCALEFLITANGCGKYPYDGVVLKSAKKITWSEWARKIDDNFEKYFWIGDECKDNLVNRRNVYKDTVNSSHKWTDYQMRPNFLIALVVAPQMVRRKNSLKSLEQVKQFLMNDPHTIGIKTLDESDFNYNGYYDNSNDSGDRRVAQGFNYHNGPEWLWPVGFYLRSLLMYSNDKENVLRYVKKHLGKLYDTMFSNDWRSLPELTNKDGQVCSHSCVSQAWSLATILELAHDLSKLDD
ncbi:glycogen debranching enzyme isoform X1 [Brachionus plicatilis]|uniref:Glycogen debranching enzyme n=1 Tax=Brachionus plicatilis TaxID=10195 RepID=A0A3M7SLJ0_BRAPC|nr:glycogen debranching enzyme isoform X1 [Brachionus plicatilis]